MSNFLNNRKRILSTIGKLSTIYCLTEQERLIIEGKNFISPLSPLLKAPLPPQTFIFIFPPITIPTPLRENQIFHRFPILLSKIKQPSIWRLIRLLKFHPDSFSKNLVDSVIRSNDFDSLSEVWHD